MLTIEGGREKIARFCHITSNRIRNNETWNGHDSMCLQQIETDFERETERAVIDNFVKMIGNIEIDGADLCADYNNDETDYQNYK